MSSAPADSPYETPETDLHGDGIPLPRHPLTLHARYALQLGLPALLGLLPALLVAKTGVELEPLAFVYLFTGVAALGGLLWGAGTTISFLFHGRPRPPGLLLALASVPFNLFGLVASFASAVIVADRFVRGRQLRDRRGRLLFAQLEAGRDWLSPDPEPAVPVPDHGAAAAWRDNGLTEHASVVAFARLAANLTELGAPMPLIENAHRDALDEMRHTRLCFDLARRFDGRDLGPGAFPMASEAKPLRGDREARLAQIATEALVDGALNEGVSARVVAELVHFAQSPAREVLLAIARDESRHAAHAWHLLRWCLREGGPAVARALEHEISRLPEVPALGELHEDEAHGLPSRARIAAHHRVVAERMRTRLSRLLKEEIEAGQRSSRGRQSFMSWPGVPPAPMSQVSSSIRISARAAVGNRSSRPVSRSMSRSSPGLWPTSIKRPTFSIRRMRAKIASGSAR